ncbi:MAG: polysaccharide pyruvyl transferase family protein [Actinomycetaceae bacterium]|nr:polysaccharide pyruvyl transferase family protein [Actinomycetaceae bacterium]
MAKIGILTIEGDGNFGNRLQNLALVAALDDIGYEAVTIRNQSLGPTPSKPVRIADLLWSFGVKDAFKRTKKKLQGSPSSYSDTIISARRVAGRMFSERFLHETTDIATTVTDLKRMTEDCSHIIVGSDQVWNPLFIGAGDLAFLQGLPQEKRLAYAASFGIAQLPPWYRRTYTEQLASFAEITVREPSGADIIRDLTGRHAEVVLDPTMLFNRNRWEEYADQATVQVPKEPYVALYFLTPPDERILTEIRLAAENRGAKVIDLMNPQKEEFIGISPLDFIALIRGADLVVSDSFHASVFSIIFQRDFVTAARAATSVRVRDLLDQTKLSSRFWSKESADFSPISSAQWQECSAILDGSRKASLQALNNMLKVHNQSLTTSTTAVDMKSKEPQSRDSAIHRLKSLARDLARSARDDAINTRDAIADLRLYRKYSDGGLGAKYSKTRQLLILMVSHTIEKGLAHKDFRPRFNERNNRLLADEVRKIQSDDLDTYLRDRGNAALVEYFNANFQRGVDVKDIIGEPPSLESAVAVGVDEYETTALDDTGTLPFEQFARSRRSLRAMDGEKLLPLSDSELQAAIETANTAPSACNRQATRVHVVRNRNLIGEVSRLQGGSQSFGPSASAIIVLTTDLRLYGKGERKMPLLDAGLFGMNLIYSLHAQGLGTCMLHGSLPPTSERRLKAILSIPQWEDLAVFLYVAKFAEPETLKVPISTRRSGNDITRIID